MNCYDFRFVTGSITYTASAIQNQEGAFVSGSTTVTCVRPSKHLLRQCLRKSGKDRFPDEYDKRNALMVRKDVYCNRFSIVRWPEYWYDGCVERNSGWILDPNVSAGEHYGATGGYSCSGSLSYKIGSWSPNTVECIPYTSFNGKYEAICESNAPYGTKAGDRLNTGSGSYPVKPWNDQDPYYAKNLRRWERWKWLNMRSYNSETEEYDLNVTGSDQFIVYIYNKDPQRSIYLSRPVASAVFDWLEDGVVGRIYEGGVKGDEWYISTEGEELPSRYIGYAEVTETTYEPNTPNTGCVTSSIIASQIGTMTINLNLN